MACFLPAKQNPNTLKKLFLGDWNCWVKNCYSFQFCFYNSWIPSKLKGFLFPIYCRSLCFFALSFRHDAFIDCSLNSRFKMSLPQAKLSSFGHERQVLHSRTDVVFLKRQQKYWTHFVIKVIKDLQFWLFKHRRGFMVVLWSRLNITQQGFEEMLGSGSAMTRRWL